MSDRLLRIVSTGVCVALCVACEAALELVSVNAAYLVFVPAIAGSCAIAGFGAALWAIFLSTLGVWYFFLPSGGFALPSYTDAGHLVVFVFVGIFVCWIIDGLRRANENLSHDNVALGVKVSVLLNRPHAR